MRWQLLQLWGFAFVHCRYCLPYAFGVDETMPWGFARYLVVLSYTEHLLQIQLYGAGSLAL